MNATTASPSYYIGMMSGTSLDGVDAVLARHHLDAGWQVCRHIDVALPKTLRETLYQLNFPADYPQGELHVAKAAEHALTHCYAAAYQQLMHATGISPTHVVAIGAHGQTIRHEPNLDTPYTVQLLNGAMLSCLTQQTVICDFRSQDIAAGGQGAPLAPIFHQQLFSLPPTFAVVNIGGIANVSVITPNSTYGFDCGPGNCLLDEWVEQHLGKPFDAEGQWASTGNVLPELLDKLLADDYFSKKPPKSTGRDYFNPTWVAKHLDGNEAPVDVMRTLLHLTAITIVRALPVACDNVVLVGGGAKNCLLFDTIQTLLYAQNPNGRLVHSQTLGFDAQHIEAIGFAILAKSCLDITATDTTLVTGAKHHVICGAIYHNADAVK